MPNGISRNGILHPSQTMPLCLFTALRHSDLKSGKVMVIATAVTIYCLQTSLNFNTLCLLC